MGKGIRPLQGPNDHAPYRPVGLVGHRADIGGFGGVIYRQVDNLGVVPLARRLL